MNATVLIQAAVLLVGLGAIAWIACTNRGAWARHDSDFGTGDNTEVYRSMVRDRYDVSNWTGDGGCDAGTGDCGGGDGGGCH